MSHMIDQSAGRDAIAFVGEVPWHGLGHALTTDAGIEVWTREAGLEYSVERAPVLFERPDEDFGSVVEKFAGKNVLYRSDTNAPLSVVSDGYKVVQPSVVMQFFAELVKHNGFHLEVAGALDGGKRIWGLARVNDGAPVIGHDVVRPYVLLATSYDGTMSTTAKFTSIRVVCHNTLTMSAGYSRGLEGSGQSEEDKTEGAVVECVRIPHSQEFDPAAARQDLGIVLTAFDRFLVESRVLAETPISETFAAATLKRLLPRLPGLTPAESDEKVEDSRTFKRLMATFKGDVPSATLAEARGTAWGLLNAITWDVDHVRGSDRHRLSSAWFGNGDAMKTKARELLVEELS